MSFMKSAMLGSAAVIVAVAGAQAADLPSKKAAPATYVKICDAYGAGFFYIPGTDTCVKLGGYVRAEYQYVPGKDVTSTTGAVVQSKNVQSTTGYEARGRIDVDARTPTSMGVARTFVRLRGANTSGIRNATIANQAAGYGQADASSTTITIESALVQWAGFTFGVAPENYALMPSYMYNANPWAGFPNGMKQIAYTATLGGGVSATIALEDRKDFGYDQTVIDQAPTAANVVANIRVDQAWGFAALHAMVGNNSVDKSKVDGTVGQKLYSSYAVGATASFKLPMIAAGDQIWVGANYAKGMIGALLGGSGLNNLSTAAMHRLIGGELRVDSNVVQTSGTGAASATNVLTYDSTSGWNINMAYTHYWAAQWRSNFSAGYVELNPPKSTVTNIWGKGKVWEVAGGIIYSPVKDFDIGLELQYASMKNALQPATTPPTTGLSGSNISTKLRVERTF